MLDVLRITLFSGILILLGYIDLKRGIIPNKIVYPAIFATVIMNSFSGEIGIISSVAGGVCLALFFIIASLLLKNLGMGDVKLGFLMGLMIGMPEGMIALVIGVFVGGIAAIILVSSRIKNKKDSMPYGPYLVFGALFALIGMQSSLFDFLYRL